VSEGWQKLAWWKEKFPQEAEKQHELWQRHYTERSTALRKSKTRREAEFEKQVRVLRAFVNCCESCALSQLLSNVPGAFVNSLKLANVAEWVMMAHSATFATFCQHEGSG